MAATMLAMPLDGKDWDWNQRGRERQQGEAEENNPIKEEKKLATPSASFRSLAPPPPTSSSSAAADSFFSFFAFTVPPLLSPSSLSLSLSLRLSFLFPATLRSFSDKILVNSKNPNKKQWLTLRPPAATASTP